MLNPYITEYPTTPEIFAGREREIEIFYNSLKYTIKSLPPSPKNIAIVGDWGVGKTSILNKFAEISKKEKCHVIKITLTPEKCRNMEQFTLATIDEIHRSMWNSSLFPAKIKEEISKWKLSTLKMLPVELKRTEIASSPSTLLKSGLINLAKITKGIPALVLMYDDMQYLVEFNSKALYDVRGVFQDLREQSMRIMLIISGIKTMFADIRGHSEPLMRFFEHIELGSFNREETAEAVNLPLRKNKTTLKISAQVIERIYEKTEGHPYFVMFFAHDIFEHKSKGKITMDFFNLIYRRIFEHLSASRFIKDISIASEKEKKVLTEMARGKKSLNEIKIGNVSLHLKRLFDKNLVVKIERGEYALYHNLFGEFIRGLKER